MAEFLGQLLVPSGVISVLLVMSLTLAAAPVTRGYAKLAALAALGTYAIFGSGYVAHGLLRPLEEAYPAVTSSAVLGEIDAVVLLTGYATELESVSPPSWVNFSSAYRILETLWIYHELHAVDIYITGTLSSALTMKKLLVQIGIPSERILIDGDAPDTSDSADQIAKVLHAGADCVLITSAGHMPRALYSFQTAGLDCSPVPTEFYTPFNLGPFDFLPSPGKLILSDLAVHEYLGLAWYWLNGKFDSLRENTAIQNIEHRTYASFVGTRDIRTRDR